MDNERTKVIIASTIYGLAIGWMILTFFASCSAVSPVGKNPPPNMKSVHMATVHWNYTQEEYDAHPDYDCRSRVDQ